mmetsp:Transcript_29527/g.73675  ORF Transcript_29527/g.73675 Transcript_29527/m.73675 type:complete len:240 (+) Transcript_29527:1299-2018(+)
MVEGEAGTVCHRVMSGALRRHELPLLALTVLTSGIPVSFRAHSTWRRSIHAAGPTRARTAATSTAGGSIPLPLCRGSFPRDLRDRRGGSSRALQTRAVAGQFRTARLHVLPLARLWEFLQDTTPTVTDDPLNLKSSLSICGPKLSRIGQNVRPLPLQLLQLLGAYLAARHLGLQRAAVHVDADGALQDQEDLGRFGHVFKLVKYNMALGKCAPGGAGQEQLHLVAAQLFEESVGFLQGR